MATELHGQVAHQNNPFARFVSNLAFRVARYRVYRNCLEELQNLSNRELRDLGLSRGEIRHVAHQEAYRNAA
ncbi:DUF1127 domain-containing protein [Pseudooceanicola sp. HF7]|nr:DUF1127 domain-containing protein [Pseudooceanicola sp. HF7]NIZ11214.1 DUF1127 domain-containing protein [Pseudooceanicola sp. HF7]